MKKDQMRGRKWVVCVCHPHIAYMCMYVYRLRTAHHVSCFKLAESAPVCRTLLPGLFLAFIAQAVLSNLVS